MQTCLSTSSLATMSPFFSALIAYIEPDFLYSASNTWKSHLQKSFTVKQQYAKVQQKKEIKQGTMFTLPK